MKITFAFALLSALALPAGSRASEEISTWTVPPYWTPQGPASELAGREPLAGGRSPLVAGPSALPFIALTPCRIIDTRGNAPLTGGFLPAATVRSYTVTNVCGIPPGAKALSLNATVVHPTGPGFLTLYPQGGSFPPVSTLNYLGNDVIVNAAVVPLSTGGGISMALGVSGGDVILDTNGYYADVPNVKSLNTLTGDLTLAAGSNVTLTPSGPTLTISASGAQGPTGPTGSTGPPGPPGPTGWALTGNAGTTPGTNFIGTTDNQALDLRVNGHRGLRIEPQAPTGTYQGPNLILGYEGNYVAAGINGATVSGGGFYGGGAVPNRVTGHFGTVGGGFNNLAGDVNGDPLKGNLATIGGGYNNWASGGVGTIGGGQSNIASGTIATVGGGIFNTASGSGSAVGGGSQNSARGDYSMVPGGASNVAGGLFSLAAGFRAKVRDAAQSGVSGGDFGTFVWADSAPGDFQSNGPNQFLIRAGGGVGINTNDPLGFTFSVNGSASKPGGGSWSLYSDARLKRDIRPLHGTLDRLLALRGVTFEYVDPEAIHELPGTRIGMVAQEVEAVFPDWVSEGPDGYRRLTIRGFEALTVEALRDLRRERDDEISALKSALETQRAEIDELRAAIDRLRADRAERSNRWQR